MITIFSKTLTRADHMRSCLLVRSKATGDGWKALEREDQRVVHERRLSD